MSEMNVSAPLDVIIQSILESGTAAHMDDSYVRNIGPYVESDTTNFKSPEDLAKDVHSPQMNRLLDFGCGTAAYRPMFIEMSYKWEGVNYADGMADYAARQASEDKGISFYDGLTLPYGDGAFNVVFSLQVFEHIQDIHKTFSEIHRVLTPGGHLVGSVSYLEQVHDLSTFNFTPFGIKLACEKAGLKLVKLYPRSDVFSWLVRRLMVTVGYPEENSLAPYTRTDNPISDALLKYCEKIDLGATRTNLLRLMYSTHITFRIEKP
ncbi:class I SAM-dependent methyltransferase [Methylorubrum extorquens]